MRGLVLLLILAAILCSLFNIGQAAQVERKRHHRRHHSKKVSHRHHSRNRDAEDDYDNFEQLSDAELDAALMEEEAYIVKQKTPSKHRFKRQEPTVAEDSAPAAPAEDAAAPSDAIANALSDEYASAPEEQQQQQQVQEPAAEYAGQPQVQAATETAEAVATEAQPEATQAPTRSPAAELNLPPSPSMQALKAIDPSVSEMGEELSEVALHLKPGQDVSSALKEFMEQAKQQHLSAYEKLKSQKDSQEAAVKAAEQKLSFMDHFNQCLTDAEVQASKPVVDEAALAERETAVAKRETEVLERETAYKDEVRAMAQKIKEQQDALNEQKVQLDERQKKIEEEESGLSREQLEHDKTQLQVQNEDLTKQVQQLSDEITALKSQVESKEALVAEKGAKIKEHEEKLAEMVKNLEETTVKMNNVAADCVPKSEHKEVVSARDDLSADKERLVAEKEKLEHDKDDLRKAHESEAQARSLLEEQKAALQQQLDEQTQSLEEIEKERDSLKGEVERIMEKNGVNEEIKALQEKVAVLAADNAGDDPKCSAHSDCSACTADARCGWCASSKTCLTGNAFFIDGSCPLSDWNWMFCRSADCQTHTGCRSCVADPKCGACVEGNSVRCLPLGTFDVKRNVSDQTIPGKCLAESWTYDVEPHGLKFLTLNVWGADTTNAQVRGRALLKTIKEANADFVALQEVQDWFLEQLRGCEWASQYFQSDYGSGRAPGGLYILSKYPLDSISYFEETQPGQTMVDQRGRVLVVVPKIGGLHSAQGQKLAIATTALDWRSRENRVTSMDFIFSVLSQYHNVALMGDFNFDTNAMPETKHVPTDFVDLWPLLHPKKFGFTWNPELNPLAKIADPSSAPSRIDRIYMSSVHWVPRSIELIGNELVSEDAPQLRPSSHFGLLATASVYDLYC